ncbi:MAG TPA: hypothetical protein VLA88_02240 [Candidatus Saccharimonadales bacterium]|nr:hypothetical protein [Candidatus Saccharimonadales bacterium]
MIDEINAAITNYQTKWQALVAARTDKQFFAALKPTSVGWKVKETADLDAMVFKLRDLCDHVLLVRMNDRWVAKLLLRDAKLAWNIPIIKILQLRPGSTDAVGMDHIDFYSILPEEEIEERLASESVRWSHEENRPGYTWASVWFEGTEAKIKNYTILDIQTEELQAVSATIKA